MDQPQGSPPTEAVRAEHARDENHRETPEDVSWQAAKVFKKISNHESSGLSVGGKKLGASLSRFKAKVKALIKLFSLTKHNKILII